MLSLLGDHAGADTHFRETIRLTQELKASIASVPFVDNHLGFRYRDMAVNLLALGAYDEAEQALESSREIAQRVVDEFPQQSTGELELGSVIYFLGQIYFAAGRRDDARAAFKQAGVLFQRSADELVDFPQGARRLVAFLSTCPDPEFYRPVDAVRHAKPITESGPENGRWWQLLGIAQCQSGQWQDAVGSLKRSIERRSGGDAFDRLFLAKAHWQLGEKDDAMKRYREALEYIDGRKMVLSRDFTPLDLSRFHHEVELLLGITNSAGE